MNFKNSVWDGKIIKENFHLVCEHCGKNLGGHVGRECKQTFEVNGKLWNKHTPGDPMPCDGDARIYVMFQDGTLGTEYRKESNIAGQIDWSSGRGVCNVTGWRYDAETSEPEPACLPDRVQRFDCHDLPSSIGHNENFTDHGPEEFTKPAPIERRYGRDANEVMQQADLAAMDDPGHLTPNQRKHIDAMEEKQAAKEKIQRDSEVDKQREHSQALTDAANAMERVKQDHGHRLGYFS